MPPESNMTIIVVSSIIMFLGVFVTALFGYLGSKKQSESNTITMKLKADKSLVDELKEEVHSLKEEIKGLVLKLQASEMARDTLQRENIVLMKQVLKLNQ